MSNQAAAVCITLACAWMVAFVLWGLEFLILYGYIVSLN